MKAGVLSQMFGSAISDIVEAHLWPRFEVGIIVSNHGYHKKKNRLKNILETVPHFVQ